MTKLALLALLTLGLSFTSNTLNQAFAHEEPTTICIDENANGDPSDDVCFEEGSGEPSTYTENDTAEQ